MVLPMASYLLPGCLFPLLMAARLPAMCCVVPIWWADCAVWYQCGGLAVLCGTNVVGWLCCVVPRC